MYSSNSLMEFTQSRGEELNSFNFHLASSVMILQYTAFVHRFAAADLKHYEITND